MKIAHILISIFYFFRRGEVTEEYIVDMQSADINRFGGQPSIVLQPLSNNTQIQKTKYYDNEVSTLLAAVSHTIFDYITVFFVVGRISLKIELAIAIDMLFLFHFHLGR